MRIILSSCKDAFHPFKNNLSFRHLGKQIERLKPLVQDATLPQGMVHGDLFADNALFKGEELISIVDWEVIPIPF